MKTILVAFVLVAFTASFASARYNAVANADSKPAAVKASSGYSKGSSAKSKSGYAKKSKSSYNKGEGKASRAKAPSNYRSK
jgi:uncharacterized protein YxeA